MFGRWRRHRVGGRRRSASGSDILSESAGSAGSGGGGGSGGGVEERGSVDDTKENDNAKRKTWLTGMSKKSSASNGMRASLDVMKKTLESKPTSFAFSFEETEALATRDWGGTSVSGGSEIAKDIWKELVPVGSGGKSGAGKGAGGGTGGAGLTRPAVRLRLRFIPLWDCLAVSIRCVCCIYDCFTCMVLTYCRDDTMPRDLVIHKAYHNQRPSRDSIRMEQTCRTLSEIALSSSRPVEFFRRLQCLHIHNIVCSSKRGRCSDVAHHITSTASTDVPVTKPCARSVLEDTERSADTSLLF